MDTPNVDLDDIDGPDGIDGPPEGPRPPDSGGVGLSLPRPDHFRRRREGRDRYLVAYLKGHPADSDLEVAAAMARLYGHHAPSRDGVPVAAKWQGYPAACLVESWRARVALFRWRMAAGLDPVAAAEMPPVARRVLPDEAWYEPVPLPRWRDWARRSRVGRALVRAVERVRRVRRPPEWEGGRPVCCEPSRHAVWGIPGRWRMCGDPDVAAAAHSVAVTSCPFCGSKLPES